jgi:outer membrane cobalamin receptor
MRLCLPGRRYAAITLAVIPLLTVTQRAVAADGDRTVSGIVVDESGRAVPRAFVRAVAAAGQSPSPSVFADERGRFALTVDSAQPCRLLVALPGFEPAEASCAADEVRITLKVGPIREHVMVTATRTAAPASQVGASITVFTEADLERRQTPLVADLLASTPGAMMIRSGAPGTLTSLFVRGGESDYNKVLLDGVPLNEPGGSFYLNHLTTENLARIEIVRGAYSSLFGSDAMASVIQLFTRRGDGTARTPSGSVQVDGGTYGTVHAAASVAGASSIVDYAVGAARLNTDNRAPNNRLENTTLSGNVGVRLGASATVRAIARAELERVGTPGPTAFGRPDLDAFFDRDDIVVSVSFDQVLSNFRHQGGYSAARSLQASTNLLLDPPYTAVFQGRLASRQSTDFRNDSRSHLRRRFANYQGDLHLGSSAVAGDHRLTLLADWSGQRATLEDRLAGTVAENGRDSFGVAAQHQILWPRLFAAVGVRVEHNDSFGTEAVPRASAVYVARRGSRVVGETRVKVAAGRGIKEPTMLESFSISPFFLGNPALSPERSRSLEAGFDQRFANDRARLEVTWFDNRFGDIISLRTNPETFEAQYFNVGVTRAHGLELGFEGTPIPAVRVRAGYTLLDSEIVETTAPTNPLFASGQWAFRRPRHSGSFNTTATWRRTAVDILGSFIGRFVDSDFGLFNPPLTENPGHTIWDARLSIRLTRRLTGIAAIDNLTDADYSEPFGYEPLGRAVRVGARVTF